MSLPVIAVLGAGDLGSACALRLFRSGFKVILIEKSSALDIHYIRNFTGTLYAGSKNILGITVRTVSGLLEKEALPFDNFEESFLPFMLNNNEIPLLTEKDSDALKTADISYLVIAQNSLTDIPAVNALLESEVKAVAFNNAASVNAAYLINREGLVVYPFLKDDFDANFGKASVKERETVKAPIEGVFMTDKEINALIHRKEEIGKINNIAIFSPYEGRLSGCLNSGAFVSAGTEIAEITSLKDSGNDGRKIPEKYTLLAGAVLEAVMFDLNLQKNKVS